MQYVFLLILEPFQWISDMENELLSVTFVLNKSQAETKESKTNLPSTVISQPMWDKILKFFIEATGGIFQEQMCNMQVCIVI